MRVVAPNRGGHMSTTFLGPKIAVAAPVEFLAIQSSHFCQRLPSFPFFGEFTIFTPAFGGKCYLIF